MCTLIIAHRKWHETPLFVAANRDEALDRPSRGPTIHWADDVPVLAPKDLRAGGTWIGLSGFGLFAAVTNRFGAAPDPNRPSRGQIVLDALTQDCPADAIAAILDHAQDVYNPFHLVVADRNEAHLLINWGTRIEHRELEPGIHVITERSFAAVPSPREEIIDSNLLAIGGRKPPGEETWIDILSRHNDNPWAATCVHGPEGKYGTRSSTLLQLGASSEYTRYLYADAPPCHASFIDLSPQARQLLDWRPGQEL